MIEHVAATATSSHSTKLVVGLVLVSVGSLLLVFRRQHESLVNRFYGERRQRSNLFRAYVFLGGPIVFVLLGLLALLDWIIQ